MGDYKEDIDQDFRTAFYIILFSLIALIFLGNLESKTASSSVDSFQNELVHRDISSHFNAITCKTVCLPDIQEYCECVLHKTSLNPFSIRNKISDYNRKAAQDFILIHKTRLSIEALLSLRLYFHLSPYKDDDLPVLS